MARFNTRTPVKAPGHSPLQTGTTITGTTHEGAAAYSRDPKTDLFLRATSSLAGQKGYYESAAKRDDIAISLTRQLAVNEDGFDWLSEFLPWLRNEGFMRTAPVMLAAEAVKARLEKGLAGGNRALVVSVLRRPDELGELVAYWHARFGRNVPVSVKRALAGAATRRYSEFSLMKYDTASHAVRFGDIIDLFRPVPRDMRQSDLFRYAMDRRHNRDNPLPESLKMITLNAEVRRLVAAGDYSPLTSASTITQAGLTWEDVLSLAGSKVGKRELWEALIPSMGYMALLRNLRNFEEADITAETAKAVSARLSDPDEVAKSMQFPYRFFAAYSEVRSLLWHSALDRAATLSVGNIPVLSGRNLVLIDTSDSMNAKLSEKSKISAMQAAALFSAATGIRSKADVWSFASSWEKLPEIKPGQSILRYAEDITKTSGRVGHGTEMMQALRATYDKHDRVFIFSDMQAHPGYRAADYAGAIPAKIYSFNLNSYSKTPVAGGPGRHELGGLTDATFRMIPVIEAGLTAKWPWEDAYAKAKAAVSAWPAETYEEES